MKNNAPIVDACMHDWVTGMLTHTMIVFAPLTDTEERVPEADPAGAQNTSRWPGSLWPTVFHMGVGQQIHIQEIKGTARRRSVSSKRRPSQHESWTTVTVLIRFSNDRACQWCGNLLQ